MLERRIGTGVALIKADTATSYSEVIKFSGEDTPEWNETDKDLVKIITMSLLMANRLETLDTSKTYVGNVLEAYSYRVSRSSSEYNLIYSEELNILVLIRTSIVCVFILPIFDDTSIADIPIEEIGAKSEMLLAPVMLKLDKSGKLKEQTKKKVTRVEIFDRRVKIKGSYLLDAIDNSYIPGQRDKERVAMAKGIAMALETYIMGVGGRKTSSRPGKRFNKRGLSSDDTAKVYEDDRDLDSYGKYERRANIIIDCSGSMENVYENAKLLAEAVNMIPNIKGKIILTAGTGSIDFTMPMESGLISRFVCQSGNEGIKATVTKYYKDILESDITMVFTDGNITDGLLDPIVKKQLEDKLVGVIVGDLDKEQLSKSLSRHFSKNVVATSAKEIIDLIMASGYDRLDT